MRAQRVLRLLPVLLGLVGCGGGQHASSPTTPSSLASGLARFDVDVRTGKVTITQPAGRALYEGAAVTFASTDLLIVNGDAGQRLIRVRATNKSGHAWPASPVKLIVSNLENSDRKDVRMRVRVRTRAGNGSSSESDGHGKDASFDTPAGVSMGDGPNATDLFVSDLNGPTIRRILPDDMVATLAGAAGIVGSADGTGSSASFSGPCHLCTDGSGTIFVADEYGHKIRRITDLGQVTTIAGAGAAAEQDGPGSSALFANPSGICVSRDGNRIYVCDRMGQTIRRITYTGAGPRDKSASYYVETIAGLALASGFVDGPGSTARFSSPRDLTLLERTGQPDILLVADMSNYAIRRIDAADGSAAVVTTIAGGNGAGAADGPGSAASFTTLSGICAGWVEGQPGLFALVTDAFTLRALTQVSESEPTQAGNYLVTTLAGSTSSGYADGDGYTARFSQLYDVTMLRTQATATTAYLADAINCRIREVVVPTDVLHIGGAAGSPSETVSWINWDARENPQGDCSKVMEPKENAYEAELQFYVPHGVSGFSFYVCIETDSNLVNLPAGGACALTTLAGNGTPGSSDGPGQVARLDTPVGVAAIPARLAGNFLTMSGQPIRAVFTDRHRVCYIDRGGNVGTLAGFAGSGSSDGTAGTTSFNGPSGIAVAPDGSLLIADTNNHRIRRVWPNGVVATVAGSTEGSSDGSGQVATFSAPTGVAVSMGGVVLVADTGNHTIRRILLRPGADPRKPSSYAVTTVAGSPGASGYVDATGSAARFSSPHQIVMDELGVAYVADRGNNRIRRLVDSTATTMSVTTASPALTSPTGLARDRAGHTYVAESTLHAISRITQDVTRHQLIAGLGFSDGHQGTMNAPMHLAMEEGGTILIADSGNHAIRTLQRVIDNSINAWERR